MHFDIKVDLDDLFSDGWGETFTADVRDAVKSEVILALKKALREDKSFDKKINRAKDVIIGSLMMEMPFGKT